MREKSANSRRDLWIARLAGRQHGVVSTVQLLAAGFTHDAIRRRVQTGWLHRIHRGVYAVGHTSLTHQGWWMAAVLACGDGAVLSHRSAAMHWGMLKPKKGPVDVAVPGTGGRKRRHGIQVHRSTSLTPNAATVRRGIPTTTPARTIIDLRRVVDRPTLEAAVAQAEMDHLPIGDLPGLLHEPTRSELERRFLRLCARYGLPKPEVNVRVGPYEVDFLWRRHRLIVETDGYASHGGRTAFQRDRARDARLRVMGYAVQRFAYQHIVEQAGFVADVLRALLDARRVRS